jgi:ligand-binding SRPBCC domain-containing protein
MITDSNVEIDAPAGTVWDVFTEVERWPEWTPSVDRLVGLDGPGLQVGRRFEIAQPRLPRLVWEVTAVDPGTSWTWTTRRAGATTLATHEVVDRGDGRTLVRQRIDQRGPLGVVVGALMRRQTRRYLDLEAKGLKARSEERARPDAPSA